MASTQNIINYLNYKITGPNGYSATISGTTGSSNYAYGWKTTGLANGAYTIQVIANEIDGANHNYPTTPISFTVRNDFGSMGDFNGDGKTDMVAIDGQGQLWMYPGNGNGTFGGAVFAGSGWGSMRTGY